MAARRRPGVLPAGQSAVIGANIRALRLKKGWSLAQLGELMGWPTDSTVCRAEGGNLSRQRRFTIGEVKQLAVIFGVPPEQLNTRCSNCGGQPEPLFACLVCGAASPEPRSKAPGVPDDQLTRPFSGVSDGPPYL